MLQRKKSPPAVAPTADWLPEDDSGREGLINIGFVTDGSPGPWGERAIAIYLTGHRMVEAIEAMRQMPECDQTLVNKARDAAQEATDFIGQMLLGNLLSQDIARQYAAKGGNQ